jgi:hypothetical protein
LIGIDLVGVNRGQSIQNTLGIITHIEDAGMNRPILLACPDVYNGNPIIWRLTYTGAAVANDELRMFE